MISRRLPASRLACSSYQHLCIFLRFRSGRHALKCKDFRWWQSHYPGLNADARHRQQNEDMRMCDGPWVYYIEVLRSALN